MRCYRAFSCIAWQPRAANHTTQFNIRTSTFERDGSPAMVVIGVGSLPLHVCSFWQIFASQELRDGISVVLCCQMVVQ